MKAYTTILLLLLHLSYTSLGSAPNIQQTIKRYPITTLSLTVGASALLAETGICARAWHKLADEHKKAFGYSKLRFAQHYFLQDGWKQFFRHHPSIPLSMIFIALAAYVEKGAPADGTSPVPPPIPPLPQPQKPVLDLQTILSKNIQAGNLDAVKQNIADGAYPFKPDASGKTPAELATDEKVIEFLGILKTTLENTFKTICTTNPADAGTQLQTLLAQYPALAHLTFDEQGTTPIILASKKNYPEIIAALIKHNPELCNHKYSWALRCALYKGHVEIIKLLYPHSDYVYKYRYYKNPKRDAAGDELIRKTLEECIFKKLDDEKTRHKEFRRVCSDTETSDEVRLCIEYAKNNLSAEEFHQMLHSTSEGRTPLARAVMFNNIDTVNLLLEAGCNVNHPDKEGIPAFFYIRGPEIAQKLIDAGAHLTMQDNLEITFLHDLASNQDTTVETIILVLKKLEEKGLKRRLLNTREIAHRTPADMATNPAIKKLLTP